MRGVASPVTLLGQDIAPVTPLFVALGVIVGAAICSWEPGVATCNHHLIGARAFDFVCGHNAPLQLVPSFAIFLFLFTAIARILRRHTSKTKSR